ncbi:hypothetical protein L596_001945 [Steinernema carpocapsae]|uniref:Secreted protein n=1 Tax=Steinernema carpocapsae TaxID=34508 RepID=A0A4U8UN78_STECR|nr:hypothetical protein L596_001945 [Steinernema carpocapsae]
MTPFFRCFSCCVCALLFATVRLCFDAVFAPREARKMVKFQNSTKRLRFFANFLRFFCCLRAQFCFHVVALYKRQFAHVLRLILHHFEAHFQPTPVPSAPTATCSISIYRRHHLHLLNLRPAPPPPESCFTSTFASTCFGRHHLHFPHLRPPPPPSPPATCFTSTRHLLYLHLRHFCTRSYSAISARIAKKSVCSGITVRMQSCHKCTAKRLMRLERKALE